MSTPLNPQEIYLLERYSSLDYLGRMRDEFAACVKAAEGALAEFMRKLPANYRKRPLYDQPDIVWGERVIPNMRWALLGLNDGYIQLSHGEADALGMASNVTTTFTSIQRDYSPEWMPQPHLDAYDARARSARKMASNISHTQQGNWAMGNLTTSYRADVRGPLSAPASWPTYRLNPSVRVKTDDKVPRNGVYLPDASHGCAQFLIEGYDAWPAVVLADPADPNRKELRVPTTWTLVERVADSGGGIPGATNPATSGIRLRCMAGEPCPRAGFWFTPARAGSRRHFRDGEVMPPAGGAYGTTIWQWDDDQTHDQTP